MTITAKDVRAGLLDFLERDLIGPTWGPTEVLEEDSPALRYQAGILFPQETRPNESTSVGGIDGDELETDAGVLDAGTPPDTAAEEIESDVLLGEDPPPRELESSSTGEASLQAQDEGAHDEPVTLANTYRPSAMGLSFMVKPGGALLRVDVRAAIYESHLRLEPESDRKRRCWQRKALDLAPIDLDPHAPTGDRGLSENLRLRVISRPNGSDDFLITLSLYNTSIAGEGGATSFYQVGFVVSATDGRACFVEYKSFGERSDDSEEVALAMLYRKRRVFAVGHGCAADWQSDETDKATSVSTTVLPRVAVPPVDPVAGDFRYLDMGFLGGACDTPESEIPNALEVLCGDYEEWIENRASDATRLEKRFHGSARDHLALCRTALARIRAGIDLLRSDPDTLEAFMLANRAMLMQQFHAKLRRGLGDPWVELPGAVDEYRSDWTRRQGFWRTFQLAFIVMTLPGLVPEGSRSSSDAENIPERDLVDLIWFPTGGGKTEAYLGLAAFTIFRRRLYDPRDQGCKILMRYTLRLLTSQQFQRAASLICACETLRRADPERFGASEISIGLWVGQSLTPNEEKDALGALARMEAGNRDAKNPFQLLSCPWCGTELDAPERLGYAERKGRLIFKCPAKASKREPGCPFSERRTALPVRVVDESIYESPPTLIIGTVDKFAMLAWRGQARSLLTEGGGPELVIQDELHLISGPLGSMVGLYEGVIEYLCRADGRSPKIIASTATIRRAREQCKNLYDRETFQFPPAGLDASDSYFAVENREAAGRVYVGFLPTAASSPLTAQIRSVVGLQQGLLIAAGQDAPPEALDPYWTLVQYFGSLKELGRAATFLSADIPEFLPTMHRRYALEGEWRRWMRTSEELTSRKTEEEIPKILKRLEDKYDPEGEWDGQALDTVLATNMISVGMDIDRLGLMMMVTQPKGTSEYIQASSRVGRAAQGPGLVFTLYNPSRPRDRSHYEHFRGFHDAFYRHVEPTSVTPFSPPALERALHAILILGGRHVAGWQSPEDFDPRAPAFASFIEFLRRRVRRIDPDHEQDFEQMLQRRLSEWEIRKPSEWGSVMGRSDAVVLMRPAGSPGSDGDPHQWEIPTSMRSVDVECEAQVIAAYHS